MPHPIFANHAHVFPASVNPDGTIDRLLRLLDACGIESAVCFAPFERQVRGHGIDDRNRWLADQIVTQPRLHGFGTIDFERDDLGDQVGAIADLGLRGIKLHPNVQEFPILGDAASRVYEAAERHDLLLTFHTGVHHSRMAHSRVIDFDEIAHRFPRLRFTMEHVGGYHFFPEALAVIFNNVPFPPEPGRRPRVFAGLTSVFTPDHLRFWYMPPERMRELIAQVGAAQVIFGLDFPYNLEAQTKLALEAMRALGLSEEDEALILGGNLRRELGLGQPL